MKIQGPAYAQMHMAQQPLELIIKTQLAKQHQQQIVEQIRRRTHAVVSESYKALGNSYEGHSGTYGADGRKMHMPQVEAVQGKPPKSVDIQA